MQIADDEAPRWIRQFVIEQINLNNVINYLYHKKDTLNRQAYNLHMKLTQVLHHTELENVIQHTQDNIEKLKSITQDRHNKKITNLTTHTIESIPEPTHKFHTRTVNTCLLYTSRCV